MPAFTVCEVQETNRLQTFRYTVNAPTLEKAIEIVRTNAPNGTRADEYADDPKLVDEGGIAYGESGFGATPDDARTDLFENS